MLSLLLEAWRTGLRWRKWCWFLCAVFCFVSKVCTCVFVRFSPRGTRPLCTTTCSRCSATSCPASVYSARCTFGSSRYTGSGWRPPEPSGADVQERLGSAFRSARHSWCASCHATSQTIPGRLLRGPENWEGNCGFVIECVAPFMSSCGGEVVCALLESCGLAPRTSLPRCRQRGRCKLGCLQAFVDCQIISHGI